MTTSNDSIPARLWQQSKSQPNAPAYYVRKDGRWQATSYQDYGQQVEQAARALIALGVAERQTVCILGFNRAEWVIMDLATMAVGGAPAGIYATCSPEEVAYIIHHAQSPVVLVENASQWEKVKAKRDELPELRFVVLMQGAPKIDDPLVLTWEEFLARGDEVDAKQVHERVERIEPTGLATMIYTSGTTGPPKAVMLTHRNLTWTADAARKVVGTVPTDRSLSYLPLSHIAEQMFSIHVPVVTGYAVYFAESIERVADNLKEVQPTVFFGVPRIWEKFHAGASAKLAQAKGLKKSIAEWAMGVGRRVAAVRSEGKEPSGLLSIQYSLAKRLLFSKVKPALGLGEARLCVTGAAPISKEILEFFAGLDVIVYEVYGQSEDTGPTSFNRTDKFRFGSVGPAFPGVEVKIADDEEILIRGPNVFAGYYKDQEATDATLIDGWLHSGDLGAFDAQGFLHITGRKKDIIITSGGKNITPKNIEVAIKDHPLVGEAVLIGDQRKFLSALIALDPDACASYAKEHALSPELVHKDPGVRSSIQRHIDAVNEKLARVESVKKFTLLNRPLSLEAGELTPTLKVRRNVVAKSFASEIDAMYAGDERD